ncbi:MAG: hypothetical protein IPN80_05515 [Flavobacterium sp.]|nr:hypothetical protein [Flavobacterium sp.]
MKVFLIKLLLVFLLFYGMLFLFQTFIDSKLQNSTSSTYLDWNLLMNGKINAPLVFLGNSRTEAHFDPEIIEKNTGIKSYNLGVAGSSLAIEQIRWNSYLVQNKPPKIVVQNIDLYALTDKPIAEKNQYLPYYHNAVLFHELQKIDNSVLYEKYVPMSKYRGYIVKLYEELSGSKSGKTPVIKKKGYQKHHSTWNSDFAKMKKEIGGKREKYSVSELNNQLSLLKKIIADCNRIHAKLILVWAPQYFELNAFQEPTLREMKNKMKQIALENKNVVFWDFTNNPLNFDKKYFYNSFHMNDVGVAQFCQQFSDSLNLNLKKPIP